MQQREQDRGKPGGSSEADSGNDSPESGTRTRRRTQAERTATSDDRMLRAAMKLIGQRGYRGTSLAAIGEEAGYSRGLVNERFGSKDGLLWVLVKNMMRAYRREVRETQGRVIGVARLCSLLDNHRRALELEEPIRALYALMFEAMGPIPQLQPEFQKLHHSFRTDIERILHEGIDAGVIRDDIDPPAQAAILLGALRGVAFQWLLDREAFSLDAAYSELKQNLHRSLTP
jgi:AcrR family transcriptional regulator